MIPEPIYLNKQDPKQPPISAAPRVPPKNDQLSSSPIPTVQPTQVELEDVRILVPAETTVPSLTDTEQTLQEDVPKAKEPEQSARRDNQGKTPSNENLDGHSISSNVSTSVQKEDTETLSKNDQQPPFMTRNPNISTAVVSPVKLEVIADTASTLPKDEVPALVQADQILQRTNKAETLTKSAHSNPTTSIQSNTTHQQPTARWVQNGVTVAGGELGRWWSWGVSTLNCPQGLFVDGEDTVIVADYGNHRIVEWKQGATSDTVLAGGNGRGKRPDQLSGPTDVIFDKEIDSLIVVDWGNRRVTRWPRRCGTRSGETIIDNIDCGGLAMDDEGSLYVTDYEKDEVRRYRRGEKSGTLVAGGNGKGARLDQLKGAHDVCVDGEHAVYVSDAWNHRVMKWVKGAKEGIVVAGGRGEGKEMTQLSYPKEVLVDAAGNVYVADFLNARVMRWCRGATRGTVVVGGNGDGEGSNQFKGPTGLSVDRQGHVYVADHWNNRVQRFSLEKN